MLQEIMEELNHAELEALGDKNVEAAVEDLSRGGRPQALKLY